MDVEAGYNYPLSKKTKNYTKFLDTEQKGLIFYNVFLQNPNFVIFFQGLSTQMVFMFVSQFFVQK
jgi:hypothetical protein